MPLPAWMIARLRESMGNEDSLRLDDTTARNLTFREEDSPHRGPYVLTRDMLNGIRPEDEPLPTRPRKARHKYVLKNGIYQA